MYTPSQQATPLVSLRTAHTTVLAKLEMFNRSGSHKDRPAELIIRTLSEQGAFRAATKRTLLVPSSGNYGMAIAMQTMDMNVVVHIFTDVLSSPQLIARLGEFQHVRLTVVNEPDATGSHLRARLKAIQEAQKEDPEAIYLDQYDKRLLPFAYEETLMPEIVRQARGDIAALFIPAGTGATAAGALQYKLLACARWKLFIVDAEGSRLFWTPPSNVKRRLPGYGNGIRTGIVQDLPGGLDHIVHVRDDRAVEACHRLARTQGVRLGPSSGAVLAAVDMVIENFPNLLPNIGYPVVVLPDGGDNYIDTLYSSAWLCGRGFQQPMSKE